jgi:hypothetical protein
MPFKLPEYDDAFVGFIQKTTHELAGAHHPLLAEMRFEDTESGASSVVDSREGEVLDLPSERVGFEMTSEHEDIRNSNFEPLLAQLDSAGAELGEQLMKIFFSSMNAVTESTGNVVDAEGKGFSFDLLFELLEKMEFSLDDNDELVMPSSATQSPPFLTRSASAVSTSPCWRSSAPGSRTAASTRSPSPSPGRTSTRFTTAPESRRLGLISKEWISSA